MLQQGSRPLEQTEDPVYSNIDNELDEEVVKELRDFPNRRYSQHSAYSFCGYIWFDGSNFLEEIWVHKNRVDLLENKDIKELIKEANSEYGRN